MQFAGRPIKVKESLRERLLVFVRGYRSLGKGKKIERLTDKGVGELILGGKNPREVGWLRKRLGLKKKGAAV